MIPPGRPKQHLRIVAVKRVGWVGSEKPTLYTWEGVYRNYYGVETQIKFSWNADCGKIYVEFMMGGSYKKADGTAMAKTIETLFLQDREKYLADHDVFWGTPLSFLPPDPK